jgi:ankyrin repeat protein
MPLHLVFLGNWDPHFGNADRPEIARMLVEHGADVSAHNKDGQTPLHLVFHGSWDPHFGKADRPEIARMLIEHGADVSALDKHSQTPLHLALRVVLEGARMLIEHGASASAQNKDGQTPLHLVFRENFDIFYTNLPEVARMLIECGAPRCVSPGQGQPTSFQLHLASHARRLEGALMLIEHGASVSALRQCCPLTTRFQRKLTVN